MLNQTDRAQRECLQLTTGFTRERKEKLSITVAAVVVEVRGILFSLQLQGKKSLLLNLNTFRGIINL